MTVSRVASAPGKVVLSGEYAVLDGAPAISMAVNCRAVVTMALIAGPNWKITAPGYTDVCGQFAVVDDGLQWSAGREEFRVVESVWRMLDLEGATPMSVDLDTSAFLNERGGTKIGIGSSAAITVALTAGLLQKDDPTKIADIARRAHAHLQSGAGSGVDIASSLHGGLIEYRVEGTSSTPLQWPDGLTYRLVWSGVAASTRRKLSKLDAVVSKPSRVRLAAASETMAGAWRSGNADNVLMNYREYIDCLYEFSVDHELGIFDAGHGEVEKAARAANLIYKPCGAGGGDVGIVMGSDEAATESFLRQLPPLFRPVDVELSETGVSLQISEAINE